MVYGKGCNIWLICVMCGVYKTRSDIEIYILFLFFHFINTDASRQNTFVIRGHHRRVLSIHVYDEELS